MALLFLGAVLGVLGTLGVLAAIAALQRLRERGRSVHINSSSGAQPMSSADSAGVPSSSARSTNAESAPVDRSR